MRDIDTASCMQCGGVVHAENGRFSMRCRDCDERAVDNPSNTESRPNKAADQPVPSRREYLTDSPHQSAVAAAKRTALFCAVVLLFSLFGTLQNGVGLEVVVVMTLASCAITVFVVGSSYVAAFVFATVVDGVKRVAGVSAG